MENRKPIKVYFNTAEREAVENYAKRMGFKKTGELIRIAVLRLASDPSFDFIYEEGSLLDPDPMRTLLRQKLFSSFDSIIDQLMQHGIDIYDGIKLDEVNEDE